MNPKSPSCFQKLSRFILTWFPISGLSLDITTNLHLTKPKLSGDIHENPGPSSLKKQTRRASKSTTNKFHIKILTLLLILLIKKIQQIANEKETKYSNSYSYQHEGIISTINMLRLKTKKCSKSIVSTKKSAYFSLLLLLAGDIHPNPGPMETTPKTSTITCEICKQDTNKEIAVLCSTCNKYCHIQCSTNEAANQRIDPLNRSFEWICPTIGCKPNYHIGQKADVSKSPNRYTALDGKESKAPTRKVRKRKLRIRTPRKPRKTETAEDQSYKLWKELTKISSTDFIGRDRCKVCEKNINHNQRAILCDCCNKWIHQRCSDMNAKKYKANMKKKNFQWKYNMFREPEILVTNIPDISVLTNSQMPKLPEEIKTNTKVKNELLIIHMNCCSIMNKLEELLSICKETDADIICLTETWMDKSVPSMSHIPPNYKCIRKDRSDEFKQKYGKTDGGGVSVIYKEHLKLEMIKKLTHECEEILWVNIKAKIDLSLGVMYRSEYTELLDESGDVTIFEENIKKAHEKSKNILLIGDLNCNVAADNPDKPTEVLTEICNTYGLNQLIRKPTRIHPKTKTATTIDHIWTDSSERIKATGTFVGISDHFGIYAKINVQAEKEEDIPQKSRNFKKYNPEDFRNELDHNLRNSDLDELISNSDLDRATNLLIEVMRRTANKHAPFIERKGKPRKTKVPWFTDELHNLIKNKKELLKDYYLYGCQVFYDRAQALKNDINHMKRKLQKAYYTSKIESTEGDPKKLWTVLKNLTKTTKSVETVEPENMTQEKANNYNKFFATIGIKIQEKLNIKAYSYKIINALRNFKFKQETEDTISKLIDRIRPDVATGTDELNITFIKDTKEVIIAPLTKLVNLSYELSQFPEAMKKTRIKALHKKDDKEEISNYRPISILPVLSKVFERAATNQIVTYLEENKIINENQHAYRKGHSTNTCLAEVTNHIYTLLDQKKKVGIASLDLSKAYDSIKHSLLLQKLKSLGFSNEGCKMD